MKNLNTLSELELRVYDSVKFNEEQSDVYSIAMLTSERLSDVKSTINNLIGFGLLVLSDSVLKIA